MDNTATHLGYTNIRIHQHLINCLNCWIKETFISLKDLINDLPTYTVTCTKVNNRWNLWQWSRSLFAADTVSAKYHARCILYNSTGFKPSPPPPLPSPMPTLLHSILNACTTCKQSLLATFSNGSLNSQARAEGWNQT